MLGEDGPPPEIVLLGSGKTPDKSLEFLAFSRKLPFERNRSGV